MAKKLKTRSMISINGADPVPMDSLPPEEFKRVRIKMGETLVAFFTEYFREHPDEAARAPGTLI